jgi:N-carbamoyl-L-amino-acid hydrolase
VRELGRFGATDRGGVSREALTEADRAARRFLVDRARALGCRVFVDDAANAFFRRPGRTGANPVGTGSHIDSQPTGGRLDGAYGVCAGLEVVAALNEAGIETDHPIEVAAWTNEEGSRFAPGMMGSAAFVDPGRLPGFREVRDRAGVSFGEALDETLAGLPDVPARPLGQPYAAFVEAHIEQGQVLQDAGAPVGVVTGVQGVRWFEVSVAGQAAHAGTTPRERRRDALAAATRLLSDTFALADAGDPSLRLTVGRLDVEPGSPNVVPERVTFTLDVRHPDEAVLEPVEAAVSLFDAAPVGGCTVQVRRLLEEAPMVFASTIVGAVRRAVEEHGYPVVELLSGAFHDAVHLARHCPTAMLFVPSIGGVSHHPAEATDPEDMAAGCRVLASTLVSLANREVSP